MKRFFPLIGGVVGTAGLMLVLSVVAIPAASAQTQTQTTTASGTWRGGYGGRGGAGMMMRGAAGVFGTVTAVSNGGDTLTVTQTMRPNATSTQSTSVPAPKIYTVDATNAKVLKNGTSSTVSAIAVNDMVMVQGTVNGTSVTAAMIRDGIVPMGGPGPGGRGFGKGASSTLPHQPLMPPIQGNGQPVIAGSIAGINGDTLTVTNASNVTYSVDGTSAKFLKNGTTTALSSAAMGDTVIVQGTVNGTNVVASSIIDQGSKGAGTGMTPGSGKSAGGFSLGIFGAIGGFFKHLFGF